MDILISYQISGRSRQFQDAVIGTRGELKLGHCSFDELLPRIIQLAKLANFSDAHIGEVLTTSCIITGEYHTTLRV